VPSWALARVKSIKNNTVARSLIALIFWVLENRKEN
jgi:hypothetical protein